MVVPVQSKYSNAPGYPARAFKWALEADDLESRAVDA
jgi:hypothetical protein